MLNVTMIGCGAIGHGVIESLGENAGIRINQILVVPDEVEAVAAEFSDKTVASDLGDLPERPDLVLECAGHAAIVQQVLPALAQGIDAIVCSIGALSAEGLPEQLENTAREHGAQLQLVSGAIAGIDAIAAARIGGLDRVVYTGRKPPGGWKGTPADAFGLDSLDKATVIFEGSAREAARQFPKNANVAATTSLAGLGLDDTEVQLIADPAVTRNVHKLHVEGAFGELDLEIAGRPLPSNPKTSALTVYSATRALRNRAAPLAI